MADRFPVGARVVVDVPEEEGRMGGVVREHLDSRAIRVVLDDGTVYDAWPRELQSELELPPRALGVIAAVDFGLELAERALAWLRGRLSR